MINSIPYNFNYSRLGFGLQIWSDTARLIRLGTRSGMPFLPFSSEFLEPAKTFHYYSLAVLIVCILILCAALLLIWNYMLYLEVRKFEINKREEVTNMSLQKKGFAIIIGVVLMIFLIYSTVSSRSISNSLSGLKDALNDMFYRFHYLSSGIVDEIVDAFAKVDQLINSVSRASLREVEAEALPKAELSFALDKIASRLNQIQSNAFKLLDIVENVGKSKSSSIQQLNVIMSAVMPIGATINGWSNFITLKSGVKYKLRSTIPTNTLINAANQLRSKLKAKSSGDNQLEMLQSVELSSSSNQAKEMRKEVDQIDNEKLMQIAGLSLNLMDGWRKAQNTMNSAFTSLRSLIFNNINHGNTKILELLHLFEGFDIAQSVAGISALLLFLVLFYMYLTDRPNTAFWPFILLVFISAVSFFSAALLVGDVCSGVFDYNPPPVIEILGPVDSQLVEQLITLRNYCSTNNSILTIIDSLGLLVPLEFNILALSTAALDNIVPMLSFSEIIKFSPDLNSSLAPVRNLDDTLGETLDIVGAFKSFNQTLVSLDLTLYHLQNRLTINDFTIISGTSEDSNLILKDFQRRLGIVRRQLLVSLGQTAALSSVVGALVKNFTVMGDLVRDSKSESLSVINHYEYVNKQLLDFSMHVIQNISRSRPIDELNQGIIRAQFKLLQDLECYTLSQEIFIIQDQMCGKVLASLDAQYFLYFIIAFLVVPFHLTMFAFD